jgi:endonuclease-3 related protein
MRGRKSKIHNGETGFRGNKTVITESDLIDIYTEMKNHFGFRNWWPADTNFEILVGAILTQQASWKSVERAISKLKEINSLDLDSIISMPKERLHSCIKETGYFRQKADNLKNICKSIKEDYKSLEILLALDDDDLRRILLSKKGIGNETCDSIMLYAANKEVFVIDAYTKRIMSRVFGIDENIEYGKLQMLIQANLPKNLVLYKDFHAQFVELGKNYCKKSIPLCNKCPLNKICRHNIKQPA